MKKWLWILLILPLFANAAYQRNQARPVEKVVFGQVDSVRYISEQQVIESRTNGWNTLLGAVIGGLVGNQFGGGTGKEVATAVGAVAGASVASSNWNRDRVVEYRLVELLIETESGQLVNVIQDFDNQMLFEKGNPVRILYFSDGVRVDITY
ncbi:glycine zipper 2TM domain-containing protein [Vibrio mexicanus]|uniref:glycine zipper 2TM domain-containing protein n=1 Tax=Vibrio mexicanus TaxID=1004326 RepID=UPI00063C578D|nr:glycine zipper 2TM domain-containing protein [Vibrio mexicanus]